MIDAPETIVVDESRIACEGEGGALGHPKVWYTIPESGWVECKYCDRRFVLRGGPADQPADPPASGVAPGGFEATGVRPDADGDLPQGGDRDTDGRALS
jgi:Uncharacterized protein conserved in bacteria